ncbi:SDR family NAD(P)-dependent oxidoreductase [Mucilaginibacter sabulilitoris]|uniref:SDR family NAD(P)-dependent oxidoreductase n=1 Tax=Mucilaginibacter sabulilitoris TaxID=1173583 RepID=A0ABZ0TI71_9SPHI|nr:SDR family NAD(P)-dependent oxidoreductase [Mucilaginibacter sabulilitoris]WPU92652.1 SDR family NAD(P)-dependent oxidoreductase [Mucilaginibacter sabulilitoris]
MKTSKNTVLITGGSAGIGFEIAKQLSAKDNHVIIVGRNQERLQKAAAQLEHVTAINADIADAADVDTLVAKLKSDFPNLNVVINNAGYATLNSIVNDEDIFEKAGAEMHTNYLSIVRLNQKLLPILQKQDEAAIVNVSSIVAFVPGKLTATYSATKAALHSYTQALRVALADTQVKVFELMPPLVDTEFSAEIGGHKGIPASQVADEFLAGLETDNYEIRVANTEQLYQLFLSSPAEALKVMNEPR